MSEWRRGDIFMANIPLNDDDNDHLQRGYRPWLVVQNDMGNKYSPNLIAVPITCRIKKVNLGTHVVINPTRLKNGMILCEQIRTINVSDNFKFIEHLPPSVMKRVDEALKISLGLV